MNAQPKKRTELSDIMESFARFMEHYNSKDYRQLMTDTTDPITNINFTFNETENPSTLQIHIPLPNECDPFTQLDLIKLCLEYFNETSFGFDDFDEVNYSIVIESGYREKIGQEDGYTYSNITMKFTQLR